MRVDSSSSNEDGSSSSEEGSSDTEDEDGAKAGAYTRPLPSST